MRDLHRSSGRASRATGVVFLILVLISGSAMADDDIAEMSLEDLMNVTVTSASKREENRVDAAAAITVLTNEDIRRSGATSVPEALRLVPGLNVARIDSSRWAISARNYNGQFGNKLLVLIDGRVVYTPFYGGVYWDVQDVVLADIDRIEVIRGPGGALWGANAVNGVINITTKSAKDTQGIHAMGLVGNQEYMGDARYGGSVGEHTAYRAYARGFKRDDFTFPEGSGLRAHDEWWQWRLGARIDSKLTDDDELTVQGDFYDGESQATDATLTPQADATVRGGNVVTRWRHRLSDRQSTEVQAYYDFTSRTNANTSEDRNTFDLQFQHDFALGADDQWLINWGTEYMWTGDEIISTGIATFDPTTRDFHRFSGFAQIQWNLFEGDLALIAGTKLEWNSYTDFEYQPTGRALWKVFEGNALWAAISRAVREPTRADRDVSLFGIIQGNTELGSEHLLAYEFGYRNYMLDNLSLDVTFFYNDYDDLSTLTATLPATFVNDMLSRALGTEIEVAWQAMKDLRFVTSYAFLDVEVTPGQGTSQVLGSPDGTSPRHTWMLRGLWNVPVVPVELDSTVWYVDEIPNWAIPTGGTVPAYWRLDLRLAWHATDWLALEVVGQNLTEEMHPEYGESGLPLFPGTWVPRSYYGKVTLTF
jgi:iron complex outermembrane receptor protein